MAMMAEAEIASLSLAIGDELTGLSNRRGFLMLGERLLAAAHRLGLPLSVVYADLNDMKAINDHHGHEAGDRALQETAEIIAMVLGGSDLSARLGGDEFCAVLVGAESDAEASIVARIEAELTARNAASDEPFDLSLSVGMAQVRPGQEATLADLTAAADGAMYAAKREKKAGRDSADPATSSHS
jgi:diguanylate cyclase (GGDEF)-like protein